MELLDKIMGDIGFLDTLIDNSDWLIKGSHYNNLWSIRAHLIQAHKELKQKCE